MDSVEWDVVFDASRGAAVVTTRGAFSDADNARMVTDIVSRPEWQPGHPILFDHRQLDFSAAGYQQMLTAGGTHRAYDQRIGNARSAILMKSLADFGVGRQFQHIVEGVSAEVAVFIDEKAAWKWLMPGPSAR